MELADRILTAWRGYTDEAAAILAETEGVPHNTITPIARMRDGKYELDLVLRNNLTTEEHPLGLYHPHAEMCIRDRGTTVLLQSMVAHGVEEKTILSTPWATMDWSRTVVPQRLLS